MIIVQDTRQQVGKDNHVLEYFKNQGIQVIRTKLYVGDYSLLNNMSISVDRKKDILEIAGNLLKRNEHERIREEMKKALESNIKLYILIEDEKIKNVDDVKNFKSPVYKANQYRTIGGVRKIIHKKGENISSANFETLGKVMKTMEEKYGCKFLFATHKDFGKKVVEILQNGGEKNEL